MAKGKRKVSVGRPTTYTEATVDRICGEIASGRSLRSICEDDGMPNATTVFLWLSKHEEFSKRYTRAREAQADAMLEEILTIADDGENDTYTDDEGGVRVEHDVIARSKLRVDTRKWAMSKLSPKKYGEKITQEHMGQVSLVPQINISSDAKPK